MADLPVEHRPIKKLLVILMQNLSIHLNMNSCWGLCAVVHRLHYDGIISLSEYLLLDTYIKEHRPKNFRYYMNKFSSNPEYSFYWKRGKIIPRSKWLKKQINKHTYDVLFLRKDSVTF